MMTHGETKQWGQGKRVWDTMDIMSRSNVCLPAVPGSGEKIGQRQYGIEAENYSFKKEKNQLPHERNPSIENPYPGTPQ